MVRRWFGSRRSLAPPIQPTAPFTLSKRSDAAPYNAKVCDFLRTHTAPFQKFPEPFLCWVGISRYYELDENNYPSFLDDNNEVMDLFSFIHHADPTKVEVAEIGKAGDQVSLIKATRGRNGAEKEHSTGGGEYVALTEAIVEPVNEDVAEKPRRKSRAAIQSLLDSSKLDAEIKVTVAANMPLVTSFVTPTPERKGGDHTDYVFGPNLHTKPASVRFVISSDSSHYSGTHVVDVEVSFLVRSTVLDPPVMTAAVTTTAVVETSLVLVSKVTVKPVNPILFGDSMSTSRHDVAGPSSPVHPKLSKDSFYAIHDLNPETLHRVYVPKWTVTNESVLDDPYMCHTLTDQLAPPALFSQLRAMDNPPPWSCSTVEATEAMHAAELNILKERNSTLEAKMRAFKENVAALESEKSGLTDQVRVLTEKIAEVDANLMGMALQLDDEFYPSYLTTVVGRRSILSRGLKLVASILGKAIGRAVDKGIQDGLKDVSIADTMDYLRLEGLVAETSDAGNLQPSHEQLMIPIHKPEDNVVLGETSLSFSLEVIHNRIQRIRGDAEA
ncbi:hypothetical protein Tco_1177052 [Tanacetum coccineum]